MSIKTPRSKKRELLPRVKKPSKRPTPNRKPDVALAILTLKGAPKFTDIQKKEISNWLRRQASFIMKSNKQCADRFTARYLVDRSK